MDDGVTVVGVGEVAAAPDVVTLTVTVTWDGSDVSIALAGAAQRAAAVADAARAQGMADRDIRSSRAGVYPVHTADGITVAAYRASHSAVFTVRDSSSVGELVEAFVAAAGDALSVDSIALSIADPSQLQRSARQAAYRDAAAKAEQFAQLAGRNLGPVTSLTEGMPPGDVRWDAPMMATRMASAMPVEGGESVVRAAVTIRWAFRP